MQPLCDLGNAGSMRAALMSAFHPTRTLANQCIPTLMLSGRSILWSSLPGCSQSYDVQARVSDGRLVFDANPQQSADCVRHVEEGRKRMAQARSGSRQSHSTMDARTSFLSAMVCRFAASHVYDSGGVPDDGRQSSTFRRCQNASGWYLHRVNDDWSHWLWLWSLSDRSDRQAETWAAHNVRFRPIADIQVIFALGFAWLQRAVLWWVLKGGEEAVHIELTGGSDVPGLNPCIRAVTLAAADRGWSVTGVRRGWQGLLGEPSLFPFDRETVRGIDRQGGTILHTSRVDPRTAEEGIGPRRCSRRWSGIRLTR
jgi:hypothetical protein